MGSTHPPTPLPAATPATLPQIIQGFQDLAKDPKAETFIYTFLACFGIPKATIAQLKSGAKNATAQPGCTLLKNKVYFDPRGNPAAAIETAKKDAKVAAQTPRFLIATDFTTLAAYDTKRHDALEISIADLHDNYAFFLPLAGMEKAVFQAESEADVKAAEHMAKLYDLIRADNPPGTKEERHALNVFLTRLLFCYFAEDTGIFPDQSFTKAITEFTQEDSSDVSEFLQDLFLTLNTAPDDRKKLKPHLAAFPYVNGGLFSDTAAKSSQVPTFFPKSRRKLIELGGKDWREINPDIFGSMFQGVVDDEKRAELGMHYTSVPNIMKVIQPLFLNELYEEFEKAKGTRDKLNKLLKRIYTLRIFDPACGSGNFLIIAYKELRKLETAVFQELIRLGEGALFSASGIQVSQFYGIELDDFAHEVAILALWLAEHQMNVKFQQDFGRTPPALPLRVGAKVVCGNALRVDWEEVCPKDSGEVFVMGNPPFVGAKLQSDEQRDDMDTAADGVESSGLLDYVTGWYFRASKYIHGTRIPVAFVSTNSISQGEQVGVLWDSLFKRGIKIHFAHRSFIWSSQARGTAHVHVVIVGFGAFDIGRKQIFKYADDDGKKAMEMTVKNISPYLVSGADMAISNRQKALCDVPEMGIGNKPIDGGNYLFTKDEKEAFIQNEPASAPYFRRWVGAEEFINGADRWCLWLGKCSPNELQNLPESRKRVEAVRSFRLASKSAPTNKLASTPTRFHVENMPDGTYLLIPRVSSESRVYIPIGFLSPKTISSDSALIIPFAEPYHFAVLTSQMHMAWMRQVCGRLESRYRYSAGVVYNNFPWPKLTEAQRKHLDKLAEDVLVTREKHFPKNLARLYSPDTMPADLLAAHRALDLAVEQCYRAKPFVNDEERLEYLFTLYEQMTATEKAELFAAQAAEPKKKGAKK